MIAKFEKNCRLCGTSLKSQFSKNGFDIGTCDQCGFMSVVDNVDVSVIENIYSKGYYERDRKRYIDITSKQRTQWLNRLQLIEQLATQNTSLITTRYKRLLDIGCGPGIFLALAKERNWDVRGIEISPQAAREAAKRVGSHRIFQDFASLDWESCDVITIWAVIEHVQEPLKLLHQAYSLLKPSGILALSTVNTNSWNRKWFAEEWRYFAPPEHLVYFNVENLNSSLKKTGFEVLSIETNFSEIAFWQGISPSKFSSSALPLRVFRRLFTLPFKLTADFFRAGDTLQVIARRP